MPYPSRALFACWVAVVLTGTVVNHRHAAALGHAHGLGWAALPGDPAAGGLPPAHSHVVLLGVELGAVPAQADGGSSDGTRPVAGEVVPDDGDGRGFDPTSPHPSPIPAGLVSPPTGPGPGAVLPASPSSNCPHLSLARTGVLRS
jgi:hypothetical protein